MNFRNEKERQLYWKKKHMENLAMENEISNKLAKAYHNVTFGDIEPIKDNRSLKEREEDDLTQMSIAKKNAMILLNNDGAEAEQLLNIIGKPNYKMFNRYALDIIEKLRGQIGKIRAQEVFKEVDYYITKDRTKNNSQPPTADQLNHLMALIDNKFDTTNATVNDILMKLDAYKTVVSLGDLSSRGNSSTYNSSSSHSSSSLPSISSLPMSEGDVSELTEAIEESENDEAESIHTLNTATEGITREAMEDLLTQNEQSAEEENDQPETATHESMYNLSDQVEQSVEGENEDDAQTIHTTPSIQELHKSYKGSIQPRDKHLITNTFQQVDTFLTQHLEDGESYDFSNVDVDTLKEMKTKIISLLNYIGVNSIDDKKIDGRLKIDTIIYGFETYKDRIQSLVDKNEREITRGSDFVSDRNQALIDSIDTRLREYDMDPKEMARTVVKSIRSIRSSVSHPKGEKFNEDDLKYDYNIARYITQGKKAVSNIKYETVKKEMGNHIYDLTMDYLSKKYLRDAPDPNVSVGAPPPQQQPNIRTMADIQEEPTQTVFDEAKTGSGLRFKNGRFKRTR